MTASAPIPADAGPRLVDGGRWRRLRTPVLVAVGAGAACLAVAVHDPNSPGAWLTCPYLATTGFYCPGCGTLRALHSLTRGDFGRAWAMNPGFVLTVPFLAWAWVAAVRRAWLGIPVARALPKAVLWALPVVIALYWILRNVPGFEFLGPIR